MINKSNKKGMEKETTEVRNLNLATLCLRPKKYRDEYVGREQTSFIKVLKSSGVLKVGEIYQIRRLVIDKPTGNYIATGVQTDMGEWIGKVDLTKNGIKVEYSTETDFFLKVKTSIAY